MKVSKKAEYALKALIELAVSYERGDSVTLINDVAKRTAIPKKYLEQILLGLKNNGILVARRGIGGGYSLNRPPEDITVGQIIMAVEGPLSPLNCVSDGRHVNCPEESSCGIYSLMIDVRNAVSGVLDNITLKELTKRTKDLADAKNNIPSYTI